MAWVTWRQHRFQAVVGVLLLLGVVVAGLATSISIRAAFDRHAIAACLPPSTRAGCDIILRHFHSSFVSSIDAARGLIVLPALAGVFVGAPLLARELEHGTYRLAWTQGVSRSHWLLTKVGLLIAAAVAGGAVLAALTMWWRQPFDTIGGRMSPAGFEIEGIVVPAYAAFALAVGALAGVLLRRTVPAMTATLIAYGATRAVVGRYVRPSFLAPLRQVASGSSTHARDWVLRSPLVDAGGTPVTAGREDLAILHAQHAHLDPAEYLSSLGWQRVVSFQPAGRFWTFQLLEAGIFVALAVLAVAATVAAVRRTPA